MKLFGGKKSKGGDAELRLFFVTDVHGSSVCFRKFINAAKFYNAQVLILGGDVAGKRLSPILKGNNGHYLGTLGSGSAELTTAEELDQFKRAAADAGLYPYMAERDELDAIEADPEELESLMARLCGERLQEWLEFAEDRLKGSDVRLFMNCGNDDPHNLDEVIEQSEIAQFMEGKLLQLDERRSVASLGYANITPWHCPRDVPEEELAQRLSTTLKGWHEDEDHLLVLNCHCPPYDSGLDTAQKLNPDLSVVTHGGQPLLVPVGSTAVRDAIERYKPILSLHGHIHESRAATKIGRTLVVNPGSEYPEGILRGALVDLDHDGVKSYVLTTG
jgi:Icc-related predicted phosphoesterase